MTADNAGMHKLMRNFAVYAPRQFVPDFLMSYELFKLVGEVAGSVREFKVMDGQGLMWISQNSTILKQCNVMHGVFGSYTLEGFPDRSDQNRAYSFVKQGGFKVDASYERLKLARLYDAARSLAMCPRYGSSRAT